MAFEQIHISPNQAPEQCPYCDGPITRERLVAIRARIREEETRKLNEFRVQIQEEAQREREAFEKSARAKAEDVANARIAEATNARDAALKKATEILEAATESQRAAIEQARTSWEADKARQLDERTAEEARARLAMQQKIDALTTSNQEAESRVEALEGERNAAIATVAEQVEAAKTVASETARADQAQMLADKELALVDQSAKLKKAEERVTVLAKERDEAARHTDEVVREADKARAAAVEAEVATVREIMKAEYEREAMEKATEAARVQEGLSKKLADLQRQVANKTASELGEGAEINLFDKLRDAFTDDRITRIAKGDPGADIKIEVLHKGSVAGTILIDSKNRKGWQESFAMKLHADKVQAEADHAILSSTAFPKEKNELCIVAGVIVIRPTHMCDMVAIIRDEIIKLHVRGLSNEKRAEKREALYRLITSEQFRQKLTAADQIREQLEKVDVDERAEHGRMWERRGRMHRRLYQALSGAAMEIDAVVEGDDPIGVEQ